MGFVTVGWWDGNVNRHDIGRTGIYSKHLNMIKVFVAGMAMKVNINDMERTVASDRAICWDVVKQGINELFLTRNQQT